jgi:hypothetical protein
MIDALISHRPNNPGGKNRINLFISEKDKYANDKEIIQKLFERYEAIGFRQVYDKDKKFRKLYNLATGKINKEDYIGEAPSNVLEFNTQSASLDDVDLHFYPLIPNIKNAILSEYDKKYIKYSAKAVNVENTNSILDAYNNELRTALIQRAENLFLSENPNPSEEQVKLFQESEEIAKFYKLEYRTEIEKWANHTIKKEDAKFDIKTIERKLLEQIITTEHPIVHIDITDNYYKPEVILEKDAFWLKSPMHDDLSQSMMVGWFKYSNIGTLLNEYANIFKEEDLKKISHWIDNYYDAGFVINDEFDAKTGNRTAPHESLRNYITFKNLEYNRESRYSDVENTLLRETTIYMLIPKKVGMLYYRDSEQLIGKLVDDQFKVTIKPVYRQGELKIKENLISGEHVEWTYINELWRGKKLDVNLNTPEIHRTNLKQGIQDQESIWLELKRHDIQYSEPHLRYGVRIPVHGGPSTDYFNESLSLVEMCATWQILYNWVWNRNHVLLATEVGKFLILNQGIIPNESLGETWAKNDLIKWALVGRDTSIAPVDTSLSNMGQSAMQIHGGVGQVVDLTKTAEILEKATLARLIKQECYAQVGLNEEYLMGNISPEQSGTSVAQGMQRSSNQIQHLYTRLAQVVRNMRITMLETAQYLESLNPTSQISYLTDDSTRVIFQTNTDGFLLHKLDVNVESNLSDAHTLERIKNYMENTNTLGANTLEMASVQTATSVPELLHKLTALDEDKKKEIQAQRQHEQETQQREIQARQEATDKMLAQKENNEQLNREKDIVVAQIKAIGYATDNADAISKEIIELQNANAKQADYYERLNYRDTLASFKERQFEHKTQNDAQNNALKEKMALKKIEQEDEKLRLREKEIDAANNRTEKIN